jgi:putative tryptophan/tyrosine transport system substrate-binding protein
MTWFAPHLRRLGELAVQSRLPAVGYRRAFVEAGGLLSYARKHGENYTRVAAQIDKILRGATPADLPVEQTTQFEFVINLKTAEALGLAIPPMVLFQADEVIR